MADPSNDQMTIYSNDMKSYGLRNGVAQFLNIPRDRVRVRWMEGPQAYGRTAADDAGFEAAFLAKELGRPVRVQWSRQEETAWDTKGPAFTVKMRGGLDATGNLVALDFDARAADHNHLGYNEVDTVLIAGKVVKREGRLVGVDLERIRRQVHQSRDYLVERAGWPKTLFGGYLPGH
jgi:xanthine dehydrogenase molybdopterin-binding subunit B